MDWIRDRVFLADLSDKVEDLIKKRKELKGIRGVRRNVSSVKQLVPFLDNVKKVAEETKTAKASMLAKFEGIYCQVVDKEMGLELNLHEDDERSRIESEVADLYDKIIKLREELIEILGERDEMCERYDMEIKRRKATLQPRRDYYRPVIDKNLSGSLLGRAIQCLNRELFQSAKMEDQEFKHKMVKLGQMKARWRLYKFFNLDDSIVNLLETYF